MCYKKFENAKSFLAAEQHCKSKGGNLALISSETENEMVGAVGGSGMFWIGLWSGHENKCNKAKTSWVWTEGTPNTGFNRWGNAQSGQGWNPPDCNVGSSQGMAAMFNFPRQNNRWEDTTISDTKPFVCGMSEDKIGKWAQILVRKSDS